MSRRKFRWNPTLSFSLLALSCIAFWIFLQCASHWPSSLFVSLSLASYFVGCIGGFLFSSFGDEAATFGKVRDWLIGAVAGLTVAKFAVLKTLLLAFASGPGPQAYALTVAVATIFVALGFFSMFFERELILNLLLAASRERRGRLEGAQQAGIAALQLLSTVPPYVMVGAASVDDWQLENRKEEKEKVQELLKSSEVHIFLEQALDASKRGIPLDWDVVSKAAVLEYYLVYFADDDEREEQLRLAYDWLQRVLLMFPQHVDFTAKYADVLNERGLHSEAVATLQRILQYPQTPPYVKQWLAAYLLSIPGREQESIGLSKEYLDLCPSDVDIARAYAQLYNRLLVEKPSPEDQDAYNSKLGSYRSQVILSLKQALSGQPADNVQPSKKWVRDRQVYANFVDDPEFKELTS